MINPRNEWILLINPPSSKKSIKTDRCQTDTRSIMLDFNFPPINLMYLSAIAKEFRFYTKIIDSVIEKRSVEQIINFCVKTPIKYAVFNLSDNPPKEEFTLIPWFRDHAVEIIGIGYFCTTNADSLLREKKLNYILRGEPELVFKELLAGKPLPQIQGLSYSAKDQVFHNPNHPFIDDLDKLPFPTRKQSSARNYISPITGRPFTTLQIAKGCNFNCNFCLAPLFAGKQAIYRKVERVIEEIEYVLANNKINEFFLRADNFTADPKWVRNFCKGLIQRQLSKKIIWYCNSRVDTINPKLLQYMFYAGCRLVTFGMESGSQKILDKMRKGLSVKNSLAFFRSIKNTPITTANFFILGYPGETSFDVGMSFKAAKEMKTTLLQIELFHPYKGIQNQINDKKSASLDTKYLSYAKRKFLLGYFIQPKIVKEIVQKLIFWDFHLYAVLFRTADVLRIIYRLLSGHSFL